MNIGFLASHNGSNMQAIIDAFRAGTLEASPVVTISNNSRSVALSRAKREGIPGYHLSSNTHPDPDTLDRVILDTMSSHKVDIVVLAGYMRKLGPKTLSFFDNRVLNIHPALLPKFGGKGMYGMHVHHAVLASGEPESGVTIHVVDGLYDTGKIIAQSRVPVEIGDSAETLGARVLQREHRFFPEILQKIVTREILLPTRTNE